MKFLLLQEDRADNGDPFVSETIFNSYEELLTHQRDEHYSEGICGVWCVVASDDDGNFVSEYVDKLAETLNRFI